MSSLRLCVISLRYSSWSMRPWLALSHAGADFSTETVELELGKQNPSEASAAANADAAAELGKRRKKGSVTGLFPVLYVDGAPIHESLAICEWVNEAYPSARLMPESAVDRARVRAISCEMLSGFVHMRTHLSCHLFGHAPAFRPNAATERDIARVFEIWTEALDRSGGPFLFGQFTIADAMYYPVRARFRSYGIALPPQLEAYANALDELPAVKKLESVARTAPLVPIYDEYIRSLGGDPNALLRGN